MKRSIAAALLSITLVHPALAHQGGHHVQGVIKEITAQKLVITDTAGQAVTFAITPATEFLRDRKAVRWEDARPGERAVVHGEMAGATMNATVVTLAGAPGPAR